MTNKEFYEFQDAASEFDTQCSDLDCVAAEIYSRAGDIYNDEFLEEQEESNLNMTKIKDKIKEVEAYLKLAQEGYESLKLAHDKYKSFLKTQK